MDTGLFHCHVGNVSRRRADGSERSAVAAAAYVSGTDLWSDRDEKHFKFGGRRDVLHSELFAPDDAPEWVHDRQALWNKVEASARRRDARLAKTIEIAFSREIPKSAWVDILREYVRPYVGRGMVADAAIHDDGTGHNPHMHVLLTVMHLKPDGFGAKIAGVDDKSFVNQARTGWEAIGNKHLAASGASVRLDRRSYKARGIPKTPTKHRGPNPAERRARRAHAARVREEQSMTYRPSDEERRLYPLLTQREDWPPVSRTFPSGMPHAEREEFARFWADQEKAAEVAAERDFEARKIPEWFDTKRDEAALRPLGRAQELARGDDANWHLRMPAEPEWQQPSREDFERSPQELEALEGRRLYEEDVFRRAVNMGRTREEHDLLKLAEKSGPEMRKRIEDELFNRRLRLVREADDVRRLEELERRMEPDLRDRFADVTRHEPDPDRYPVPGPYWEAEVPSKLRHAQDDMSREYERDEDR